MKPKAAFNLRSKALKGKIVKKEPPSEEVINMTGAAYNISPSVKASVEIVNCISYQKFRYSGENRPGKKYQEKEFMTLKLSHLQDKVVRVVIICTDADNRELIHPNGLVGKDCHDGIYDKEYAVTKPLQLIKIPYLRTERMKTKKNEHKNILGVLSARASHLPSPYRERCLSQCTDKYTSSREKFDTTKVCLGVIVTVESHPGILNGSLHAISHVVRNASEKTSLSILKLSNDSVPALTGAYIDIFTTEDGPAIEPDKYLVYISCDSNIHGMENWQSEKLVPGKENLLYKRVITYEVPPFEPNPNLDSPVEVTLHLECPQSNQFCDTKFSYIPQREMVVFDDQCYLTGQKRGNVDNDVKPSPKKLRSDLYDNDGSTESIKANLKTKIKARNETPNNIVTMCMENQGDAPGDEETHYITDHKQHNMYIEDRRQLICHQDPQTGESTYLLNMDACKSNNSNEASAFVSDSQYVIQFQEKPSANHVQERKSGKHTGQFLKAGPQDFKVVATGYSDTVPANTVLVYTTNGILPERVDEGTLDHMFIQTVPDVNQLMVNPSFRHGEKHVNIYTTDGVPSASIHKASSGHIIRRDTIAENRSTSYTSELTGSDGQLEDSQASSDSSAPSAENRLVSAGMSHNAHSAVTSTSSITSPFTDRYGQIPTSFPSSIPPIRRMLIPSKTLSNSSPWAVDDEDDSASDYNIVVKTFETSNKRSVPLKSKSIEEDHYGQRTEYYVPPSSQPLYRIATPHAPEKQLQHVTSASERDEASASRPAGLSSIDVTEAIVNNLPTMQIFEIAEQIENSMTGNNDPEVGTQNN